MTHALPPVHDPPTPSSSWRTRRCSSFWRRCGTTACPGSSGRPWSSSSSRWPGWVPEDVKCRVLGSPAPNSVALNWALTARRDAGCTQAFCQYLSMAFGQVLLSMTTSLHPSRLPPPQIGASFPVYCMANLVAPKSGFGASLTKPFIKFIVHSSSYCFFLSESDSASLGDVHFYLSIIIFPHPPTI